MKTKTILTLLLVAVGMTVQAQEVKSIIIGKVHNRPQSKTLLLTKAGTDLRVNHYDSIPIDSLGNFEYKLRADNPEAYMLIFKEEYDNSVWYTEIFFPDTDTVYIDLHPEEERLKNRFRGGNLNKKYHHYLAEGEAEYKDFNDKKMQLINSNDYFTEEFSAIMRAFRTETNESKKDSLSNIGSKLEQSGTHLKPQGKRLEEEYTQNREKRTKSTLERIAHDGTLVGFYELIEWLNRPAADKSKLIDAYYNLYAKKFPNHPYTERGKNLIKGIALKVGEKFIDFTAPDSDGKNHTLSKLITDKVAMINLWASWCGPCRRHGKELIPVYEAYKDKGFTVVGVARELKKEDMYKATEKDKYPWLNLLELNDAHSIWAKYGVTNAGGRLVLVNKNGTILAIDPPIAETIRIIAEELQN